MSATQTEFETVEGSSSPTSADLQIVEAMQITEGAVQSDGSVLLHLIRPCIGRGRGKHLYPAAMLEANAEKFSGWKMYLNHLSEAARRALGGLPRDVREVGGIVDESWWDPSVPAEGRFGPGAVIGRVKPIDLISKLIDLDPRLVECSINATATGVQRGKVAGEDVWVVEGISNDPPGSVDWVTEAGAGGQVKSLMESVYAAEDPVDEYLGNLSYKELMALTESSAFDLSEAASKKKQPTDGDGDDDEGEGSDDDEKLAALVKKFMDKGMPRKAAELAAGKAMSTQEGDHEGDDVAELTPEQIREALSSEEGQGAIALAVREELKELNLGGRVESIVESRLDEERERMREEADTRANRRTELTEMRDHARTRIEETKLTPKLQESLKRRFDLVEGNPTAELNLVADIDDAGSVTKSARTKLDESLDSAIKESYEILAEANPTRIIGQGPRVLAEGEGGGGEGDEPTLEEKVGPLTAQLLREAGIDDPSKALAITPESVLARQGIGD